MFDPSSFTVEHLYQILRGRGVDVSLDFDLLQRLMQQKVLRPRGAFRFESCFEKEGELIEAVLAQLTIDWLGSGGEM
jgi:hypothetical protein